jgi:hypothetical protein
MKTTGSCIGLGVALLLMATGTSRGQDQAQKAEKPAEKSIVEGRWAGYEQGRPGGQITLLYETNRFTYWDAQTNEIGSGIFVINSKVKPMEMDLTFQKIAAPEYVGKVGLAVFEVNGDVLKIAGAEPGSIVRPTNTVAAEGVRAFIFDRQP